MFAVVGNQRAWGVPPPPDLAESRGGPRLLPPERAVPRVISAANAWLMADILSAVTKRRTGVRVRVLNHNDIGGKNGVKTMKVPGRLDNPLRLRRKRCPMAEGGIEDLVVSRSRRLPSDMA